MLASRTCSTLQIHKATGCCPLILECRPESLMTVSTWLPLMILATDETKMTVVEHGYATEEARNLSQAGLEQCIDKMDAIWT